MICYGPVGTATPLLTVDEIAYQAVPAIIYRDEGRALGTPPLEAPIREINNSLFNPQPKPQVMTEKFDWRNKKTNQIYAKLEQKVLAKVATNDEQVRYRKMKQDRNSKVFADRQLKDYEEIRRLQQLSKKLLEIQQYLQPIPIK